MAVAIRVSSVGARLDALLLGKLDDEAIGVDLASGAFVRMASDPGNARPFDIVRAEVIGEETLCSPYAPEAVAAGALEIVGRLTGRKAERFLRTLADPAVEHLLGFAGPAQRWWTLEPDRPSVALVTPSAGPMVQLHGEVFRCRFAWRGRVHDLPLEDHVINNAMRDRGWWQAGPDDLAKLAGRRVQRALVALGPPVQGHCYKVVAGLLTRA